MRNLLICIICLVLVNCGKSEKVKNLNFEAKEGVKASDFYNNISFVKLEMNDECLIFDPTEVKISDDKIFIVDKFAKVPNVFVFSISGDFIGKISRQGVGPGEYLLPGNLICDEDNRKIYLTDLMKKELLTYDLDSFSFIESYKIPFYSAFVEYLDRDHLIWYVTSGQKNESPFNCHIQITDLKCNPVKSWIEREELSLNGPYNILSNFTKSENGVAFHHPFLNEYYSCSLKDSISPLLCLNFQNLNFPTKEYVSSHAKNTAQSLGDDNMIQYCDLFENEDSYHLFLGTKDKRIKAKYDKRSNQGIYFNVEDITDDLGLGLVDRPKGIYRNQYFSFISTEDLQTIPSNSILHKYIDNNDLGKNPIMMFYD